MSHFQKNIEILKAMDPALARRVSAEPLMETIRVSPSKKGPPVPRFNSVYLHSSYDPVNEAHRLVSDFKPEPGKPVCVLGLALGYHLQEILNKVSGDIYVVEPRIEIFRAFMEHGNLAAMDSRVRFLISEPVPKLIGRFGIDAMIPWSHPPSIQISSEYFHEIEEGLNLARYLKKHPLKVLVVNPVYGGSLPTAQYCAAALKKMGHRVESVDCQKFVDSFFEIKKVTENKEHSHILGRHFMNLMDEVIVAKAADFRPDLVLALAQAPLSPEGIDRLKNLEVPLAFWFVEDFRILPYWKEIAGRYDHFMTIQEGEFLNELRTVGAKPYYLPQGCWPEIHRPLPKAAITRDFEAQVSFMGAAYYNRMQSFSRLLDFDIKIWGEGWDKDSIFGKYLQNGGKRVSSEECVKIYNGGKVNINLHSSTFHEGVNPNGDFINPRTFELASCGAFQLVDERSNLDEFFLPGEIATFGSIEELRDKIHFFLENPEARKGWVAKSRERVLREHSMAHRMEEMLIHVFSGRRKQLERRLKKDFDLLETAIEEAGPETELAAYLGKYRGCSEFSFKKIIESIHEGDGELSDNETLFLMLDQVIKDGAGK